MPANDDNLVTTIESNNSLLHVWQIPNIKRRFCRGVKFWEGWTVAFGRAEIQDGPFKRCIWKFLTKPHVASMSNTHSIIPQAALQITPEHKIKYHHLLLDCSICESDSFVTQKQSFNCETSQDSILVLCLNVIKQNVYNFRKEAVYFFLKLK